MIAYQLIHSLSQQVEYKINQQLFDAINKCLIYLFDFGEEVEVKNLHSYYHALKMISENGIMKYPVKWGGGKKDVEKIKTVLCHASSAFKNINLSW